MKLTVTDNTANSTQLRQQLLVLQSTCLYNSCIQILAVFPAILFPPLERQTGLAHITEILKSRKKYILLISETGSERSNMDVVCFSGWVRMAH